MIENDWKFVEMIGVVGWEIEGIPVELPVATGWEGWSKLEKRHRR
jgi:hypothetical protein